MDERRTFSSLVLQFTLAANLCTFFYLMTLSTRTPNGYYPLSMLVYSPAVYLLNKLFLSRPQTMRRLVLLNTAVGALFFLVYSSAGRAEGDAAAGICSGILSLDNHEGGIPKSPRTYTPRNDTESGYKRRNAGPPDGLHLDHGERYPMGAAWSGRLCRPPAWA